MATKQFRANTINDKRLAMIEKANEILGEYDTKLTVRQLYYQFVSRDLIPNTPRSYQNMTVLVTDARYAGLIDWDALEDRGREVSAPLQFNNLRERVDLALNNYRLPRWEDQPVYAELWVEKQALAGVLKPLADRFHAPLMVNKGYSSASAMYESAERINEATGSGYDKESIIFYLGDHDPSGEDMVRDIQARLEEFGVENLEVRKLALTMAQIRQFNPPPNPAKLTDSRAKAYIEKFGNESWEVDALPPRELTRIITRAFESVIDRTKMDAVIARENSDKERLRELVKSIEE